MSFTVRAVEIPAVLVFDVKRFGDSRGFFSETYSRSALRDLGVDLEFIQDNHSRSARAGTVRGLHFQIPPFAQNKLVRVTQGAILDVAVDLRHGSPTFGRWVGATLSAENWQQILIPVGFAHGFVTLTPDTEVQYKVTAPYAPTHDKGLLWNDPALGIDWPVTAESAILSEKDRHHPLLANLPIYFTNND